MLLQWPGRRQGVRAFTSPLGKKKPKLHESGWPAVTSVRCHDTLQVVLSDYGGLSPEALRRRTPNTRWPGSAQVGTSLRADILFLESLTDADTRSSGYQDQDLGPCGHGHASHGHPPLLVHRRVCIPYIHCNSSTRTRNGIKYITVHLCIDLTGAGLRLNCIYTCQVSLNIVADGHGVVKRKC